MEISSYFGLVNEGVALSGFTLFFISGFRFF